MFMPIKAGPAVNKVRRSLLCIAEFFPLPEVHRMLVSSDGLDLLRVNPAAISCCIKKGAKRRLFVSGGDWDINEVAPISEVRSLEYSAVHDIFIKGVSYKRTVQYAKMKKAVSLYIDGENKKPSSIGAYWCRSYEDIDEYFRKLDRAYESIKKDGYKTQKEVSLKNPDDSRSLADEIQVLIGRRGGLILGCGGTHRILIAQSLGLERVYVRVAGIHEAFIGKDRRAKKLRDEVIRKIESLNE
ncbi:hypothetical protein SAMN05661010_00126 [Modicisalibacter muralis]|uniref:Uncharacterized protein n=1 Tax=Modicisalibacter muralis TaxID=119000 RepID=A0A1G9EUV4_9GAMM|nr:hypothetical protein [Halomonas muralis]SDK79946.1 hypothetical protein SAMN05661010_00126 [Halomonas muralis]